jgi:hypothetical protein
MCAGCKSYKQEFYYNPESENKSGSMGDKGIAIKDNPKYDGTGEQDQKFEGMAPGKSSGAKEVEYTGRQ